MTFNFLALATSRLCALALVHSALFVLIAAPAFADDPPAKPPAKSLDAQLLDGLDADLLKDLPGAYPAGNSHRAKPAG